MTITMARMRMKMKMKRKTTLPAKTRADHMCVPGKRL
jgi:hypothetical protein